jgi:hypothetical protein
MKPLAATALPIFLPVSALGQANQAGTASAQDSQTIKIIRRGSQPSRQGRESGSGAMAHFLRNGQEVEGCREPRWGRCHPRASVGNRNPRQHPLPDV